MNYKLLVPTYRTRYNVIMENLQCLTKVSKFNRILNLGCGEGDYDTRIKTFCKEMYSCDVNEDDINFCKTLNKDVFYSVEDARKLAYADGFFDCIVCVDVLEHISGREEVISEMFRILKPEGYIIITVPQKNFPFSYDPVNGILKIFKKKVSIGAYGYGHDELIIENVIEKTFEDNKLELLDKKYLSKGIVGLMEMYWTGVLQSIFKSNSRNKNNKTKKKIILRPDGNEKSFLISITDFFIKIDRFIFKLSKKSIGLFYLLKK
jgi:2-polyprenyl-3-methyl-5-hydroxy-6-metoxy-1,4-benzoquinol methylase